MSQLDRYSRTTPTYAKKDEESKVLREKQLGSVSTAGKTTPLNKTTKTASIRSKLNATNENRVVASSKIPFRLSPKPTLNKAKPSNQLHSAHLSSHNNDAKLNTPINRNIRSAFGSAVKQESASKDSSARKTSHRAPVVSSTHRVNTSITTPLNRNYLSSSINSSSKANKTSPCPIVNGHDYSAIMSRKAELGYSGVGYVVEYDCDEKDLKHVHVTKGLWKITTCAITPNKNSMLHKMGAPQFATRLDIDPNQQSNNTPGKTIFHNLDFDWTNPLKATGILRHTHDKVKKSLHLSDEYLNNPTAQCLDLETSHNNQQKKSLRWADILEENHHLDRIEEKQSPALGSPYILMSKHMNTEGISLDGSGTVGGLKTNRKMRRSFSMNDINDILIMGDEDEDKNDALTNQSMDHRMQFNYNSPTVSKSDQPVALNETFELETPSKHLIAKESLIVIENPKPENEEQNLMEYETDCSLNELMIPFSLSAHDKTLEDIEPEKQEQSNKPELKLNIPYENSRLIENLQVYNINLKATVALLHLNDSESELTVSSSEFIKICNLVGEMEKSLRTIKGKLSSK